MQLFGLFVGEFVNWMNKRLPDEKKVFSKDFFTEYKREFKPNYILMIITSIIYIGILYRYGIHNTFLGNLDLIKYIITGWKTSRIGVFPVSSGGATEFPPITATAAASWLFQERLLLAAPSAAVQ